MSTEALDLLDDCVICLTKYFMMKAKHKKGKIYVHVSN